MRISSMFVGRMRECGDTGAVEKPRFDRSGGETYETNAGNAGTLPVFRHVSARAQPIASSVLSTSAARRRWARNS